MTVDHSFDMLLFLFKLQYERSRSILRHALKYRGLRKFERRDLSIMMVDDVLQLVFKGHSLERC